MKFGLKPSSFEVFYQRLKVFEKIHVRRHEDYVSSFKERAQKLERFS